MEENFDLENLPVQKIGAFNLKRRAEASEPDLCKKKIDENDDDEELPCSQIVKTRFRNKTDALQCLLIGKDMEEKRLELDYAHERRFNRYLQMCKNTTYSYGNKDEFFSEIGTEQDRITFKFGSELPIKVRLGQDSSNCWKIFLCKKNYSTKQPCVMAIPWADLLELVNFLKHSMSCIEEGRAGEVVHSLFLGSDDNLNNPREEYFWSNAFVTETGRIRIKFLRIGTRFECWWNALFIKCKKEDEEKEEEKKDEKKEEKGTGFGTVLKLTTRELSDFVKVCDYIEAKCPKNEGVMLGHNLDM